MNFMSSFLHRQVEDLKTDFWVIYVVHMLGAYKPAMMHTSRAFE